MVSVLLTNIFIALCIEDVLASSSWEIDELFMENS